MSPGHDRALAPEELVDQARAAEGRDLRTWCTAVARSPEARSEFAWISAFDADPDEEAPSPRAVEARVSIAVEGALATLDELG